MCLSHCPRVGSDGPSGLNPVPDKICDHDDVDENCSEAKGVICEIPSVASIAKAVSCGRCGGGRPGDR